MKWNKYMKESTNRQSKLLLYWVIQKPTPTAGRKYNSVYDMLKKKIVAQKSVMNILSIRYSYVPTLFQMTGLNVSIQNGLKLRNYFSFLAKEKTHYLWRCLSSKLSINLSDEQLPWEQGMFSFKEFTVWQVTFLVSACLYSWPMSFSVSDFSSSPNSKRCNISSLDIVLYTCCLSTTLAASPSFVTWLNHSLH